MPELPEVETVRRMLEATAHGRRVQRVRISGKPLHGQVPRALPKVLRGRTLEGFRRHGKFLLIDVSGDLTLISHLGMSGRWLFVRAGEQPRMAHVHARLLFQDGSALWFQDARRFGMLRACARDRLARDPSLAPLGPDPLRDPPTGAGLHALARGARVAVKNFLLDQKRIAGVGNIYASEILHRAGVDPRRRAGSIPRPAWDRIAAETIAVMNEAVDRLGTTFSMYRTVWGEPGGYGERLRVYDRAGQPCRTCGGPIRRIVQGQRSTYFCPTCQRGGVAAAARTPGNGTRPRRASGSLRAADGSRPTRRGTAPRGPATGRATARRPRIPAKKPSS